MCYSNYFNEIELTVNKDFDEDILLLEASKYTPSFFNLDSESDNEILNNFYIKQRKNRELIKNSFIIKKFLIGDILEFVYFYKHIALTFNGICIGVRKKSFVMPDMSLILRNIIIKTGIEVVVSYFYNRIYNLNFLDYKRKFYTFTKNKLYFVRERLNRESRVI